MLNAKSGISELLQPAAGAGAARRQDTGSQDSSGLFGDTLKGQMHKAADAHKPAAREAERPARTEGRTETRPEKRAEPGPQEDTPSEDAVPAAATADAAATGAPATDSDADGELVAGDAAMPSVVLLPQDDTGSAPESEIAAMGTELPAEVADGGNILPPALPQVATDTADAALTGGTEDSDIADLPRWMHSLAAAGRGREQAVAGRATQEPVLAGEGEDALQNGAFLKGLQAVTAQLDSQHSDLGSRQGQGQGAEALFKLLGLTVAREAAPPPMNMAASTVSAATAATAPAAAPAVVPAQTLALDVPMRQAGWDQAFAERVVWMAKQGVQEAQIHLNPRNMGPIDVHVSVQKEQASVAFVAHHAVTREALEAAMPRLRDMLQESGLNLAQSEVSQHDRQREQAAGFAGGHERGQHGRGGAANDEGIVAEAPLRGGSGLGAVDYYA